MIATRLCLVSLLLLQLALININNNNIIVKAHPGAVAQGRATCGIEYSTADTAYKIPDIKEAWYIRRLSTCESPVFWTTFEVTRSGQELYIASISPAIARFQDQLTFHGILHGPGIGEDPTNGLAAIPSTLPEGVTVRDDLGGAGYIKSPDSLASCGFVDSNQVMRDFSDVINGRCMEKYTYAKDYDNELVQGATVFSWWLYSHEHKAVQPGTYYLQTWLTSPDVNTTIVQGKYELTLAPWIWYKYASNSTLTAAQSQGTSCACAYNGLDYRETAFDRLGGIDASLFQAQLPGGSCEANPTSTCSTIDKAAYRSDGSAIEWSGIWSLKANQTYEWTYFAYYDGNTGTYGYPDLGMFVYVVESDDIESVAAGADASLKEAVDQAPTITRAEDDTISIGDLQYIEFTNTSVANSTIVLFQPTKDVSIAVFTQHVPSEFMAHVLKDRISGEYVFPTNATLYLDDVDGPQDNDEGSINNTATTPEDNKSMGSRTVSVSSRITMLLCITAAFMAL